MKMAGGKISVLGGSQFTLGFTLAGVDSVFTEDETAPAEAKLTELIDSREYSIIVISEKLSGELDWKVKKRIDSIANPVVIALPDIGIESSEAANIRALIKRALGFDMVSK
jgi:vacuolar-type H+-ATPase subunit F/Vma7